MGATEHRRALLWGWCGARQARALLGDWLAGGTQALLTRARPEDPSLEGGPRHFLYWWKGRQPLSLPPPKQPRCHSRSFPFVLGGEGGSVKQLTSLDGDAWLRASLSGPPEGLSYGQCSLLGPDVARAPAHGTHLTAPRPPLNWSLRTHRALC